nr:hypothetical protein [Chlamydiota bacterium]
SAILKKGVLENENQADMEKLQNIEAKLSEKEKIAIVEKSKELKAYQYQQEHQDLEVLPKITLNNVPKELSEYPLLHDTVGPFDLYSHTCFTNEILYVDLIFDLPFIKEEDLGYLQLFAQLLTEVGNQKYSYLEQLDHVQEHLGDLCCQFALYPNAFEQNLLSPTLQISTRCLYPKAKKAFSILQDLILKTHFNEKERIKELLGQIFVSLQNAINQNALGLASQLALSGYYDSTFIHEKWYGLEFYWFVKDLVENFESSFELLQEKMQYFSQNILNATTPHIVLACSEDMLKTLHTSNLFDFSLPRQKNQTRNIETYSGNYNKTIPLNQGRLISSDVFFTALGFKTASNADPLQPYFCIASALMENVFLHKAIRERGGAYGAGCRINASFGTGYFFTYRDPNLSSSLDAFHHAIDGIKKGNYITRELEDAKLINLQKLNMPIYPNQRALRSYGFMRKHKGLDLRLRFFEQIIEAGPDDIKKAIEILEQQVSEGVLCVFGSESAFEKQTDSLKTPLPLFNV